MTASTEAQVKSIVAQSLGLAEADIRRLHDGTDFCVDLGVDSLDWIELWMQIEEYFVIDVSDADADGVRTLGDLVRLVEMHEAEALCDG